MGRQLDRRDLQLEAGRWVAEQAEVARHEMELFGRLSATEKAEQVEQTATFLRAHISAEMDKVHAPS